MAAALAFSHPAPARVPAAIGVSAALHAAGMLFFLQSAGKAPETALRTIDNVDILEQTEERKRDLPEPKSKSEMRKELAKNFLKMALPARPRGLREVKMEAPAERKLMMDVPKLKLDDRKLRMRPDMKLDLSKDRPDLAKIQRKLDLGKRAAPAALPKLAEVGVKRAAPKVLQLAKLAEEREMAQRGLGSVKLDLGRREAPDLGPKIAAKTRSDSAQNRLLSLLPEKQEAIELRPQGVRRAPLEKFEVKAPAPLPTRTKTRAIMEEAPEKKKAVEIEGPLSNRKVVDYSLPAFPKRLEEYGVYEAEVKIKFYVSPVGTVLDDPMVVERTSSYGWLDRLAMSHLKKWRFEPLPLGGRNEWGVITFRFFLE